MPEQALQPSYQLTATEKTELAEIVKQTLLTQDGGIQFTLSATDKQAVSNAVYNELNNNISAGLIPFSISEADKADIIQEVLAELYAQSQDVKTLEEVSSLDGINSIPAVRSSDDAIVSVPIGLLTTNQPIEVSGQEEIDILVAQGKIVATQLYFTPVDDE